MQLSGNHWYWAKNKDKKVKINLLLIGNCDIIGAMNQGNQYVNRSKQLRASRTRPLYAEYGDMGVSACSTI